MPDIIYSDLIGTKPIIIKTTNTEVKILGDTSKYKGKITIPTTVTDLYLNANLLCQIIHDGYSDLKHLHLHFNRGHSNIVDWDLAISNVLDEALKNEAGRDKAFVLSDSGAPGYKQTKVIIKGNNIGFKGIIITTHEVKEVVFGKNSFVRTVNINGTPLKYTFTGDNKVIDYNDYETLETKNKNVKVNVISNNGSSHLKNEIIHGKKKTNINVERINVGKNGRLTFGPNNPLFLGKK